MAKPTSSRIHTGTKRQHQRITPKQARAKKTVDRILSATIELIEEGNTKKITTNKIAERAFINIATLYQYFPNKDAIFATLFENALNNFIEKLLRNSSEIEEITLRKALHLFLELALQEFRKKQTFYIEMYRYSSPSQAMEWGGKLETSMLDQFKLLLQAIAGDLRVKNIDLALTICVQSGIAIISRHVLISRSQYSDEALVEELNDMLVNYLIVEHD